MQCDVRSEVQDGMGLVKDDDEYDPNTELCSIAFREKLDAGLCEKLFEDFRSKEKKFWIPSRKVYTVVLAALVMESGAKISDDNMQHLRDIAAPIHPSTGDVSSLDDCDVLSDTASAQLLAALEHYKPGKPRSFRERRSVRYKAISLAEMMSAHKSLTAGAQLLPLWKD